MGMKISAGKLWGLRRLSDGDGYFEMIATDQRPLFARLVADKRGVDPPPYDEVAGIVTRIAAELQSEASAILLDPIYGYPSAIGHIDTSKGILHTYESLDMDRSPGGAKMGPIPGWSVEKIRRIGGDAVKVLVLYRTDASLEVRAHQEQFVQRAGEECVAYDIPFLLEALPYPLPGETEEEYAAKREALAIGAVAVFKEPRFAVDIFKLGSPGSLTGVPERGSGEGEKLQAAYHRMVADLPAPWVLLSAGMNKDDFRKSLAYAYEAGASGYLAGRGLWSQAPPLFPDFDAISESLRSESLPYMRQLNELTRRLATPWFKHASVGGVEPGCEPGTEFALRYAAAPVKSPEGQLTAQVAHA
jgi:tagatose 1,6-diphosphate aldolase